MTGKACKIRRQMRRENLRRDAVEPGTVTIATPAEKGQGWTGYSYIPILYSEKPQTSKERRKERRAHLQWGGCPGGGEEMTTEPSIASTASTISESNLVMAPCQRRSLVTFAASESTWQLPSRQGVGSLDDEPRMVARFTEPHQPSVVVRNTFLDLREPKEADIYRRRRSEPVVKFEGFDVEEETDTSDAASICSENTWWCDSTPWKIPTVALASQTCAAQEAEPMEEAVCCPCRSPLCVAQEVCPGGHKLQREPVPYKAGCDSCNAEMPLGAELMRCSTCQYDLCLSCHEHDRLVVRNTFFAIDAPKECRQRLQTEPSMRAMLDQSKTVEEDCESMCSTDASEPLPGSQR